MAEDKMPARIWVVNSNCECVVSFTVESLAYRHAYIRADLVEQMAAALRGLVEAKALSGVRDLVAGWNGENRADGPYKERHPSRLGATLPKTNCGDVYALDEAMQRARAALSSWEAAQ